MCLALGLRLVSWQRAAQRAENEEKEGPGSKEKEGLQEICLEVGLTCDVSTCGGINFNNGLTFGSRMRAHTVNTTFLLLHKHSVLTCGSYLTESVNKVVLQKSIPAQIRQLILD